MATHPPRTPAELLAAALAADPARPLLTFYDDRTGERAELSVRSFDNWVAKTANLLQDDLAAGPGTRVAVRLPCHWQAAVWLAACWACGAVPSVGATGGGSPDVAVTAYDELPASRDDDPAAETVGLGLGPLALARRDLAVPEWVDLDYDREVPAHGDRFAPGRPPGPDAPALEVGGRTWSGTDLVAAARAAAGEWAVPAGGRMLVTAPADDLRAVLATVLVPLVAGSGVVLCRGRVDPAVLADRVAAEQVTALLEPGAAGGSDPVRRVGRP